MIFIKKNICYRDLKPENILVDNQGHIRIVDFGFSKKLKGEFTYTCCGTMDYIAPEILTGEGHNKKCDIWSFGCLLYELFTGICPFYFFDKDNKNIYDFKVKYPSKIPKDAINLLKKIFKKKELRIGINEVMKHKFFKNIIWNNLREKKHNLFPVEKDYCYFLSFSDIDMNQDLCESDQLLFKDF